jgi:anti-sigma regulatory factor (Ser/Thr protein kinase)
VTATAAAAGTRRYTGSYPADPVQVRHARAALAALLDGCPLATDAILIASEFATNSVLHSASREGGEFPLRAEIHQDHLRIEVEDAGGPWRAARTTTATRTDSMSWQQSPTRGTWAQTAIAGDAMA